jgi:hypothetical protein
MKKNNAILFSLLLLVTITRADISLFNVLGGQRAGTSVFTFLKIGVGARALGMGNAAVALSQDASSIYWNPAATAQVGGCDLTVSQLNWFADIKYSYIGYVQKMSRNVFLGFSAGALYMDPIEITTEYEPYGSGEYYNFGDLFLGATFSHKMTDHFSYGITLKYIQENLAELVMNNVLMDLGTFYWTGFKSLRFCVSLVNFGSQTRPSGTFTKPLQEGGETESKYTLFSPPTEFRIGSAIDLFETAKRKTLVSVQLNHPVDNAENLVAGIEQSFYDIIALRVGILTNQSERSFSLGGGMKFNIGGWSLAADYAWSDFGILGDIHNFQISFKFDEKK